MPSRWIDQGAVCALPILSVDSRVKSGQIEVALKQFVSDKTNWRKMLKNETEVVDLMAVKNRLLPEVDNLIDQVGAKVLEQAVLEIDYPVESYPSKITSLNFDKTPVISGILKGIKGQYLLLDTGVLNIRKFSSYEVEIES